MSCPDCQTARTACAFDTDGNFLGYPSACGTITRLRALAASAMYSQTPSSRRWSSTFEDESIGVLYLEAEAENDHDGWVVMTWYKDRNQVTSPMLMVSGEKPVPLTLSMAQKLLRQAQMSR